jgi:hypothetical protein
LLTTTVAEGRVVEVPTIIPESIFAVGDPGSIFALVSERIDALTSAKERDVVHILVFVVRVGEQRVSDRLHLRPHI